MSANKTYQNFVEKLGGTHADNFIGDSGMMFWNPETGELRLGDGVTQGGVSLFKALASDFGVSADGGNTISSEFNVITYDGGNATSPYNIYEIVDGNVPNAPTIQFDSNSEYIFSNTITVSAIKAGGATGTNGQVLTSTGYNTTVWKTPVKGFATTYSSGSTVLSSNSTAITITGDVRSTFTAGKILKFSSLTLDEFTANSVTYDSGNDWTSIVLAGGLGGPVDGDDIYFEIYEVTELYPGNGIAMSVADNIDGEGKVVTISAVAGAGGGNVVDYGNYQTTSNIELVSPASNKYHLLVNRSNASRYLVSGTSWNDGDSFTVMTVYGTDPATIEMYFDALQIYMAGSSAYQTKACAVVPFSSTGSETKTAVTFTWVNGTWHADSTMTVTQII
jgi:hypothetical protein